MFLTIITAILILALLVLGILRNLLELGSSKPTHKSGKILTIAQLITTCTAIYLILQVGSQARTERFLREALKGGQSLHSNIDNSSGEIPQPGLYKGGIPQSPNITLRAVFEKGVEWLEDSLYGKASDLFEGALNRVSDLQPSDSAVLLIHLGIAYHGQSKWDEAEDCYNKVLDWAKKGGYHWAQIVVRHNFSKLHDSAIKCMEGDL